VNVARVRHAGDSAVVLALEEAIDPAINERALAIARRVEASRFSGVLDVVPTYHTVGVFFDPLVAAVEELSAALVEAAGEPARAEPGRLLEVPVRYGGQVGPDLDAVAALAGLSANEVIERHSRTEYRVYMLGFLPGFAYMGIVDDRIAVPRHPSPRLRVPAGSVGIAGRQTGVYPVDSPGGWQIIGRTSVRTFDPTRSQPSFFAPGDRVRFVPDTRTRRNASGEVEDASAEVESAASPAHASRPGARGVSVIKPGLFTTIQDAGRWGHQSIGVPVSGALDIRAFRRANALVGNDPSAAVLEATIAGPELLVDGPTTVGIDGADLGASLDEHPIAPGETATCDTRAVLRFGARRGGARAYIAFSGGIDTPPGLGSRATHVRIRLGGYEGRALRAGDRVPLGPVATRQTAIPARTKPAQWPGGTRLRVIPGPHDDWFTPAGISRFLSTRFTVSPSSDRMGYRLTGGGRIPRAFDREMISDVTVTGAVQVPASGDPILLMADRQTTGGYPQIAVVISADLPRAAQLVPGDWVEFEACSRADAVAVLAAERRGERHA
jgi:KipI family sensor histidine kinase inhibitor